MNTLTGNSSIKWFVGTLATLCTIGLVIGVSAQSQPAPPSSLMASVTGANVTLQWQPPSGGGSLQGYVVEAGSAPGASDIGHFPTHPLPTMLAATNVAAGTYFVRVRATNSSGQSAPSNEVAVHVGAACAAPPSAPSSLAGSVSGFAVQLAWGISAGQVASYILEAGSAPGGTDMGNFDLGTTTSYFASTVPPGTYYVRVKARNACGVSDASNEVTLTVGAACSAVPGVPGTPAATVSGSSVQLTWGLSSGSVSTYVLEVGSTPGATNLGVYEVGTGSDYRVSGVANGTYYVRLRARNPCGLSLASDTVTLTVDATPAGPPRLEIINSYTYTIETGPNAGHLMVMGEVINRGGAASAVWLSTEVFAKDGSRLRGITSSILGRSRRNTNTGQIESWGLGPGETGCFGRDLGEASEIGRYEVQMAVEADPTTALVGQMQAELTSWYVKHIMGYPELVVFPKATNVGSIPTAWNSVAFMGKDTAGRVVACGQWRVYGPTNAELPGYGFTNVLRPGESAYPLNGQPWVNSSYPAAAVASLTAWPLWTE